MPISWLASKEQCSYLLSPQHIGPVARYPTGARSGTVSTRLRHCLMEI